MTRKRTSWTEPVKGFQTSRRRLPHWQDVGRVYFVTFRTNGWQLPAVARDIVLEVCLANHGRNMELHAIVVMPDHVHLILQPLPLPDADPNGGLDASVHDLGRISHAIKSYAAHQINRKLGRKGKVWQTERFDRIIRHGAEYTEKLDYILNNPVKRGLAAEPDAYPWLALPEPIST